MPGFHYYCTRLECARTLDAVLTENHLQCAIDRWYASPFCEFYESASNELIDTVFAAKRRVFLVGDFTRETLCLDSQDSGPLAGRYSIDISRKGPTMSFSLPTWFEEDGMRRITSGTLDYQPRYYDEDLTCSREPSAALKAAYKAIQTTLKRRLTRINLGSPIWISSSALELVNEGQATVLVRGNWVGGPIESPSITPRYRAKQ